MAIKKDDILEALGIDTGMSWLGPAAAAFGIGLLVGAAAALVFAPKSGSELRDDIAQKFNRVRQRANEVIQNEVPVHTSPRT